MSLKAIRISLYLLFLAFGSSYTAAQGTGWTNTGVGMRAQTGDLISAEQFVGQISAFVDPSATYYFTVDAVVDARFNYLDSTSTLRTTFLLDGVSITVGNDWNGPGHSVNLRGSELARLKVLVGNELYSNVAVNGYSFRFLHNFYSDPTPSLATPTEIVDALYAFGSRYAGTSSHMGCVSIVMMVTAAAGAPFPRHGVSTGPSPTNDQFDHRGHWTAIYSGDSPNAQSNWWDLLQPGDVVGQNLGTASNHEFIVINYQGNGQILTIDNIGPIGLHVRRTNESERTKIKVWRLDPVQSTPSDRILNWAQSKFPTFLTGTPATQDLYGYKARQYSSGWIVGTKDDRAFTYDPVSKNVSDVGALGYFLDVANVNGY